MGESMHRQACVILHVAFANELKDYCWGWLSDCVVIEKPQMLNRLNLERIKNARMALFQEDVSQWFPYFEQMSIGIGQNRFHSCYLSRLPFPVGAMKGAMRTQDRQIRLCEAGLKTTIWCPEL